MPIYDADKTWNNDSLLCWAAAASNALYASGWAGSSQGFSDVDEVFAYFRDHFEDKTGYPYYGLKWFFSGIYDPTEEWDGGDVATLLSPGGGFYPSLNVSKVLSWRSAFYGYLIPSYLSSGGAVTCHLAIRGEDEMLGHEVSVYGYKTGGSGPSDPRLITGLSYADPDDGQERLWDTRTEWFASDKVLTVLDYNTGAEAWAGSFCFIKHRSLT